MVERCAEPRDFSVVPALVINAWSLKGTVSLSFAATDVGRRSTARRSRPGRWRERRGADTQVRTLSKPSWVGLISQGDRSSGL